MMAEDNGSGGSFQKTMETAEDNGRCGSAKDDGSGGSFRKTTEDDGLTHYNRVFGRRVEVMHITIYLESMTRFPARSWLRLRNRGVWSLFGSPPQN